MAAFAGQTYYSHSKLLQPGVAVKNIVLCFDRTRAQLELRDATNVEALFHLLDDTDGQIGWYDAGGPAARARRLVALRAREAAAYARATIAEAYQFLVERWERGDR